MILSRKGFDASHGGMPSPILPGGRLLPLPIPSDHDRTTFADLGIAADQDLDKILTDLSGGRFRATSRVHLDPDLGPPGAAGREGWRPLFGQSLQSQAHLESQGVGMGDVFLFFGWFRSVALRNGAWRFMDGAADLHVFFGWLEIGDVLSVVTRRQQSLGRYPWIADHPHVANPDHYKDRRNTLYVSSERSRYSVSPTWGGGRFHRLTDHLCLTKDGCSRSIWSLPTWFFPCGDRPPLTYHHDPSRWTARQEETILRSVGRGQEFVLDCDVYPEAEGWIADLVRSGAG